MSRFTLAIASGKGGTGKTTLAVAIAQALGKQGKPVHLLDTDVEAPNAHLFLGVTPGDGDEVKQPVPKVDEAVCTGCGVCREVCEFNAIAMLGGKPLIVEELCHSCGACVLLCPEKAIGEERKTVGWTESATPVAMDLVMGRLKVGEARSTPVIDAVRRFERADGWTIIDAPPGTSCPVISAVRHTDYVMLVTEPTPFGLNDLRLAVDMLRVLDVPMGVVINRADIGTADVSAYCAEQNIPVLLEIPFDRNFAKVYAAGGTLLDARPDLADVLVRIVTALRKEVAL